MASMTAVSGASAVFSIPDRPRWTGVQNTLEYELRGNRGKDNSLTTDSGKYIIGLTGNIATGKSVVRRMLEHLGAYTIDADALAHRAIGKGAPGHAPVVRAFGSWILDERGEIDRQRLGRLVFSNSEALARLEEIVHPLVRQAADILIQRSVQKVVVLEAIKLLESPLRERCNTVWVTYAPAKIQLERLMRKRGFSREEALRRIESQAGQRGKLAAADVVIRNAGSYEELWKQVLAEWNKIAPPAAAPLETAPASPSELSVERGRPRDSKLIAELVGRLSNGLRTLRPEDVMAELGEKAFLILRSGNRAVGLAAWQVENLVARTTDLYVDEAVPLKHALDVLIREIERASSQLQCEASLVFPPPRLAVDLRLWEALGYEQRRPETLSVHAWQEAAYESEPDGAPLFFKQLRRERVLRPI